MDLNLYWHPRPYFDSRQKLIYSIMILHIVLIMKFG